MQPTLPPPEQLDATDQENLILVVRADPIICGHSTEARNLAEAAIGRGFREVHIVSYPLDVLAASELPLKPIDSIVPYSEGITVDRPAPVGDYKVLDGRLGYAISGHLVDLLRQLPGRTAVMDLYLVPHGQMVIQAVEAARLMGLGSQAITTIGEAVGSDITNVVQNAVATGQFGAAALVLQNYLSHDLPVAVSEFTKQLIVAAGAGVDQRLGTQFVEQLSDRIRISYPAIDTSVYLEIAAQPGNDDILARRGLEPDGFILFLSRLSEAKGVDDLIHAYRASNLYGQKVLLICGNGPDAGRLREIAGDDPWIRFLDDVGDEEKSVLMYGCYAYCLPSKPRPEFTETFGIAIAEAMLAGGCGPVITTRTGGIPEATGDHCLYHAAGDVAELTARLNEVAAMTPQTRAELCTQAQEYAQRFDRKCILDKLLSTAPLRAVA